MGWLEGYQGWLESNYNRAAESPDKTVNTASKGLFETLLNNLLNNAGVPIYGLPIFNKSVLDKMMIPSDTLKKQMDMLGITGPPSADWRDRNEPYRFAERDMRLP
ncbi:hypothetical protein [Cloacibacillus evryensis]|uniref:hypothetical protein n=1 Tax=Cloacibacillus evryensis TaxID=508460 RepID=UPI002B20C12F|nr:hypothetical protein [Cloacibacillus evryensis]MEA5034254.1 hypothetical protein [Cloacibacillus evryensis]